MPTNPPVVSTICTRSLPVSATAIRPPCSEKATERGPSNCPGPSPDDPDTRANPAE